ncbi:RecX family transcriptional regulator [Photobacterium damselae]|uniref:RecX family transcriptional regulator n=1 Tax=Photobacterium damselae TaxID=38293 RepID=UPI004067626D
MDYSDEKKSFKKKRQSSQKPKFKQVKSKEELMGIAIYHLETRDHSQFELRTKLLRNVESFAGDCGGEELIQQVFNDLIGFGYLKSDADFANNFVERSFSNQYGLGYVRTQLGKKGIRHGLIEDTIEKMLAANPIDFNFSAKRRLEDRYYNGFDGISREKVESLLRKWGFNRSEISYAISSHPLNSTLLTKTQIKGANANLEREVLKLAKKLKGMSSITMQLRLKCVDVSNIKEIVSKLENTGDIDFFENAKIRLSKKRYDLTTQKGRSGAYAHLASNGFNSEQIKYAISGGE